MGFFDSDAAIVRTLHPILLVIACNWGVDYMMEPPKSTLYSFERIITPMPAWGALLLFLGIMGLLGEQWIALGNRTYNDPNIPPICFHPKRWLPSYIAHIGLSLVYAAFAFGCAIDMIYNEHWYGLRVIAGVGLGLATGHAICARRRRHAL